MTESTIVKQKLSCYDSRKPRCSCPVFGLQLAAYEKAAFKRCLLFEQAFEYVDDLTAVWWLQRMFVSAIALDPLQICAIRLVALVVAEVKNEESKP